MFRIDGKYSEIWGEMQGDSPDEVDICLEYAVFQSTRRRPPSLRCELSQTSTTKMQPG